MVIAHAFENPNWPASMCRPPQGPKDEEVVMLLHWVVVIPRMVSVLWSKQRNGLVCLVFVSGFRARGDDGQIRRDLMVFERCVFQIC